MAIPFYENEEHLQQQQHQVSEETDQVDGPIINYQNIAPQQSSNSHDFESSQVQASAANEQDLMAWKILAMAMCKALKDHYQQHMAGFTYSSSSTNAENTSNSSTAVIQIIPKGQVQPEWN